MCIVTHLSTVYPLDFSGGSDVYSLVDADDEAEAVKWCQITDTMLTKYGFTKRDKGT